MNANGTAYPTPAVMPRVPPERYWQYQSFLELGAYLTASGAARGHVRSMLLEWGVSRHEEAALAVVSELVTNSVQATRMCSWVRVPPVRLWLYADPLTAMLAVWDALPGELAPPQGPAAPDDEDGRGLIIVDSLSAEWGTYCPPPPPESCGGKVTWALLPEASS